MKFRKYTSVGVVDSYKHTSLLHYDFRFELVYSSENSVYNIQWHIKLDMG